MAQEKEIEITNRKVKIKEILFIDMMDVDNADKKEATKTTLKLGSDLTEEEIGKLSVADGIKVTKAINEVNGFTTLDFQKA